MNNTKSTYSVVLEVLIIQLLYGLMGFKMLMVALLSTNSLAIMRNLTWQGKNKVCEHEFCKTYIVSLYMNFAVIKTIYEFHE